jgi:hypothetical protein
LIIRPGIFAASIAKFFSASIVPVIVTLGLGFLAFRPFDFFALDFFFAAIVVSNQRVSNTERDTQAEVSCGGRYRTDFSGSDFRKLKAGRERAESV